MHNQAREFLARQGHDTFLGALSPSNKVDRTIFVGYVRDVVQFWHLYEISLDFNVSVYGTPANLSNTGYGVRSHTMYVPGTYVVCYRPPEHAYCYILGAIPPITVSSTYQQPSWLAPYCGVGLKDDSAHGVQLDKPGGYNFNHGTPYDVMPGEMGYSSPLGMIFNFGLSSVTLKANELTGLWLFYLSQTAKLAGHNFIFWSALRDHYEGEDEGENLAITRSSPFPWEMRGSLKHDMEFATSAKEDKFPADPNSRNIADPLWQTGQHDARHEPVAGVNQDIIPRITQLEGILGDLFRWTVSCPPTEFTDSESSTFIETKTRATPHTGLAEVAVGIDGAIQVGSRKSISIVKDCYIPVVKQIKTSDDPDGDTNLDGTSAYRFAGVFGAGQKQSRSEFLGRDGSTQEEDGKNTKIAQLLDNVAWVRHKLTLQTAHTKSKDFLVCPNTAEDVVVDSTIFALKHDKFRADIPAFVDTVIDHRKDSTRKLYKNKSGIHLLDDGRVVIEDGWGSQIVLERGNIILSCPGDVMIANGRSFTVLAPKDINLRAGENADMSAGNGDLRLKAEKNLHALAGNSGKGGALIESRGAGLTQDFVNKYGTDVSSSGVVIKATNGVAAVYGTQVYLRSMKSGAVILDADSGDGIVETYASSTTDYLKGSKRTIFGSTPGANVDPTSAMEFTANSVFFGQTGTLVLNADIVSSADAAFQGNISGNQVASSRGGELSTLTDLTRTSISAALTTANDRLEAVQSDYTKPTKAPYPYQEEIGIGLTPVIQSIGFTFRTDDKDNNQYKVDFSDGDYSVFWVQARWQQGAESIGEVPGWSEPYVASPDGSKLTLPFPGYNSWVVEPLMLKVTPKYWLFDSGDVTDYSKYDDPRGGAIQTVTMEAGYLTNS